MSKQEHTLRILYSPLDITVTFCYEIYALFLILVGAQVLIFCFYFNCILFNPYEATEIIREFTVPATHITYRCFNWLLKIWRARGVSWRLVYINAWFCEEISSVRELHR